MGHGINFKGSNHSFGAPKGMTKEQVYTLHVRLGIDTITDKLASVSVWEFTPEEEAEIKRQLDAGEPLRMNMMVLGGQPPISISPLPYDQVATYSLEELEILAKNGKAL